MKKVVLVSTLTAVVVLILATFSGNAIAGKPNIMESCKICHKETPASVRGKMVSVSEAFKSFNVNVGPIVWIVKYDDSLKVKEGTKVSGPETIKAIRKGDDILVTYSGNEDNPIATHVAVKQPYKIPAEQQISLEEVKKLIAGGTSFTLADSRPPAMYAEGHMPGAVSMPYPKFADLAPKLLPNDKSALVIFYCAGET